MAIAYPVVSRAPMGGGGPQAVWPKRQSATALIAGTVAYMLTLMSEASELVRSGRQTSGLSVRALADRAGVPPSTISRIEAGRVDPTYRMLVRILDAADQELDVALRPRERPRRQHLAELWDAYNTSSHQVEPDWTRLRAFLDALGTEPERTAEAIRVGPPAKTPRQMTALLAGIAEKLADEAHLARPAWTSKAPVLKEGEWRISGTPRMQAAIRAASPLQLLRHGLAVDEGTLWRHRAEMNA